MALLEVFAVAMVTALATGLGALPVGWFGADRVSRFQPLLLGVTAGVMIAASIGLLIEPIASAKYLPVGVGLLIGVIFLIGTQRALIRHETTSERENPLGKHARRSLLVFAVLFVHSLPEGFAIGSAWASEAASLGLFVFIAISVQNIPEGTATAIPMVQAGYSRARQFRAAVGTSLPQPIGAVIAFLLVEQVRALLPWSLGFAAGAMLALVVVDLLPESFSEPGRRGQAVVGVGGAIALMALTGLLLAELS